MPAIVFPTSSSPGLFPQESAGRLINAFAEKTAAGAPGAGLWRRSAGLFRLGATSSPHTRGFMAYVDVGDTTSGGWTFAFWVTDNQLNGLIKDIATGNYTSNVVGAFPGTKPVTMARNNRAPVREAVAVAPEHGCFVIADTITPGARVPLPFPDTDLPAKPTSVCSHDGYFVWSYLDGRVYASQLNSLDVNPLSFNTEQGQSVLRVISFSGRLYAMGDKWIGVYKNAGTKPFPFLREATIPRGLLNTNAVAGWEPGWSNELIWVGDDHVVYKLNGYIPVPIGTDAVTRTIQRSVLFRGKEHIEAFVYMYGKNPFWVITSVEEATAAANWTWEYNGATGQWNERKSQLQGLKMEHWRGHRSIKSRDEWILGDASTSNFYIIKEEFFAEGVAEGNPHPHVWTVESGVMSGFPQRMVIPRASFNITSAVGRDASIPGIPLPVPNPKVKISWSLDGGYTWGVPVVRALGPPGDARYYPSVICSGLSRGQGIRYRLEVEDPVHVGLSGGEIDIQTRSPI